MIRVTITDNNAVVKYESDFADITDAIKYSDGIFATDDDVAYVRIGHVDTKIEYAKAHNG